MRKFTAGNSQRSRRLRRAEAADFKQQYRRYRAIRRHMSIRKRTERANMGSAGKTLSFSMRFDPGMATNGSGVEAVVGIVSNGATATGIFVAAKAGTAQQSVEQAQSLLIRLTRKAPNLTPNPKYLELKPRSCQKASQNSEPSQGPGQGPK